MAEKPAERSMTVGEVIEMLSVMKDPHLELRTDSDARIVGIIPPDNDNNPTSHYFLETEEDYDYGS